MDLTHADHPGIPIVGIGIKRNPTIATKKRTKTTHIMLLSKRYHFLFVHIAKTGGTSIRAALRKGAWRDPWAFPQWICHTISRFSGHRLGCKIPRHATALTAQQMLPPDYFASLFKFALVRNPWDRMLSVYGHFQRERTDLLTEHHVDSFPHFVDWLLYVPCRDTRRPALIEAMRRPQTESLTDRSGHLLVDFVGRFENLEGDFADVCFRIGTPGRPLPQRRRSGTRIDYRTAYDDATANLVGTYFQQDVARFGYRFDATPKDRAGHRTLLPTQDLRGAA